MRSLSGIIVIVLLISCVSLLPAIKAAVSDLSANMDAYTAYSQDALTVEQDAVLAGAASEEARRKRQIVVTLPNGDPYKVYSTTNLGNLGYYPYYYQRNVKVNPMYYPNLSLGSVFYG